MSLSRILFPFEGTLEEPWVRLPNAKLALDFSVLTRLLDEIGNVMFAPFGSGSLLLCDRNGLVERAIQWREDLRSAEEIEDLSSAEPSKEELDNRAVVRLTGRWGKVAERYVACLADRDGLVVGTSNALKELEQSIGKEILVEPNAARDRILEFLERMSKGLPWVVPREGVSFLRLFREDEGWVALAVSLHQGRLKEAWSDRGEKGTHQDYVRALERQARPLSLGVTVDLAWVEREAQTHGLSDLLLQAYKEKGLLLDPVSPGLRMALSALRVANLFGLFDGKGR